MLCNSPTLRYIAFTKCPRFFGSQESKGTAHVDRIPLATPLVGVEVK